MSSYQRIREIQPDEEIDPLDFMVDVYADYCGWRSRDSTKSLESEEVVNEYFRPFGLVLRYEGVQDHFCLISENGRTVTVDREDFIERLEYKWGLRYGHLPR